METTTNPVHDKVNEYAASLIETQERVRATNFVRFSSIYNDVHTMMRGSDAFAIKIRRAFNRWNKIAIADENPDCYAGVIADHIAHELDPTYEGM